MPSDGSGAALVLQDVSHVYEDGTRALDGVELQLEAGELVALVGPSGCGKSTLLSIAAGLLRPSTGRVLWQGRDVTGQTGRFGYMLQKDLLLPWRTVLGNVLLGRRLSGRGPREHEARALLARHGLGAFADHYPHALSGGMRQRVALLRTLAFGRDVLLLDEPFGALDDQTRLLSQAFLLELWALERATVLLVTHDLDEAIFLADRVLVSSARPGRILRELRVPLARPRAAEIVTSDAFAAAKRELFAVLHAEALRAARGEEPSLTP